jgi:hypothetical protein
MKFKHLKNSSIAYFRNIAIESSQIQIEALSRSLWLKNVYFFFIVKNKPQVALLSYKHISNYCIESGRSKNLQNSF